MLQKDEERNKQFSEEGKAFVEVIEKFLRDKNA